MFEKVPEVNSDYLLQSIRSRDRDRYENLPKSIFKDELGQKFNMRGGWKKAEN